MKSWRQSIESTLLSLVISGLRIAPRRLSLCIGETLGGLVALMGIRRGVTEDNLRHAFPDLSRRDVERLACACYRHFGALLAEFARLSLLNRDNVPSLVEFEGLELLEAARATGKGGIVVSGHFGNWELMGGAASVSGYPVSYVVTRQQNVQVERMMDQMREKVGVEIIKRREAIKGVLKALRANGLVAILSDQDAHEAGAFVPFFGRLASTPKGAATFALRSGAALIFAESYRQGTGKLKVRFSPVPMEGLPEQREDAIVELTRRFTAQLEEAVRRHPEQWFWMHRRWKTPPTVDTEKPG